MNLTVVYVLLYASTAFLVWSNWRRSKRNVIAVKKLNEEIIQQKINLDNALEELKNNHQEKDRILRTVTQDLRTPIKGIAALTNMMVEENEQNPLKHQLKIIKETSADTLGLINEILDTTDDSTPAELEKQFVDINTLLGNSIELLKFKAAEKNQNLQFEKTEISEELYINREMISRVINNLISNAIKFSPVKETIQIKLLEREAYVQMSVTDNGIGIPLEMNDKVFDKFTDAKRPGTIGEKSFGLGLSICKQIIENHNGKIWFYSAEGKGTAFYMNLPKASKEAQLPNERFQLINS